MTRFLFRFTLAIIACLLLESSAFAQSQATPSNRLAWDTPDVAVLADANASVFKLYVDQLAAVTLAHTCVAGTPISCSAPIPAMTAGQHALTITRSQLVNSVLTESPKSSQLAITMLILAAPQNLRIVAT